MSNNYFNSTGTIGFTCDVCGRELLGCTWANGMRFCAKCYQETFGETDKDRRIADLEAKLAECEEELNNSEQKCFICNKDKENEYLKQQIEESEEYIEMLLEEKSGYIDLVSGYSKKCKQYEQQLAEKEKAIENYEKFTNVPLVEMYKMYEQDKIDYAVEQLEKVKELVEKRNNGTRQCSHSVEYKDGYSGCCCDVDTIIDKLITEIKEGK